MSQPATTPSLSLAQRWEKRLEALRPDQPMAYLELAEEVADMASADRAANDTFAARRQTELATHLFALAGSLDPQRLGRSACLAIAAMTEDPVKRRQYRSVAAFMDRRAGVSTAAANTGWNREAAVGASEALSLYRRGLGGQVLTRLDRTGGRSLLERHAWSVGGDIAAFADAARRQRNQSRPGISATDLTLMLQFEVGVLTGDDRPWSADLQMSGGTPLPDVDPQRLEELFGIDISRCVYRAGQWVAPGTP